MSKFKKVLIKLSYILWLIDTAFALFFCIIGEPMRPIMVLMPSLVCCINYAELNWRINRRGGTNEN